ncbi:endonuclease/exonuclease/phosphatase family protein [Larsenimonas rhizosphaerae]|uniref:Endonuclease/exonuclease/phosphatase family protein n=1 Tax=Larsenimonas rhizosphaerae TaxID=2944682 RepID=A0AA41ZJ47_9GAMM|nr:endonuclease/exonuclease/phosphatase family protein [Larsenimonas rhizosphaerae]MCM2131495.1 endonuclease/exonuclease/phosphatase family protein [Larsenimonas rhizosphaerae]MCX2525179.1 endonuclease/exonuclease/phosphatase family protein [Larsenimonas rhizosphaerae]
MMEGSASDDRQRLRLLTFNLQVGIHTHAYRHYLTRSWQHLLPHPTRQKRLDFISDVLKDYDVVALQEVDGGSFRSGHINQTEYLAKKAGFDYCCHQLNRNFGHMAKHSNGVLSQRPMTRVENHRLPGPPGRGAIHVTFGHGEHALHVFAVHLALGQRTRDRQLDYLSTLIEPVRHVVLLGDLNCTLEQLKPHTRFCSAMDLSPGKALLSYPAWQPKRALDHILVSKSLETANVQVLDQLFSDHLPLAIDIILPDACSRALAHMPEQEDPSIVLPT